VAGSGFIIELVSLPSGQLVQFEAQFRISTKDACRSH
jgi:hypothetical protein